MKLHYRSLAVLVALVVVATSPMVLRADTIYYQEADAPGIRSVSGTIVLETDTRVEITTAAGQTVSIARGDVFQIIRDTPPAGTGQDPIEIRDRYPAASAVASGATFDDTPRSAIAYHYGFKGGLNIANVRADPQELEDGDSLRGYAFGVWWAFPLGRRLAIQAEALFSMKGDAESAAAYSAATRLGYIDMPVLAKVGFLHDARVRPSLLVGPSLGFNLSANSNLESGGSDVDVDVKGQVSGFDFGFVVGGVVDFELGGGAFGVDVRYTRGLSDIGDGAAGSARNDVFSIMGAFGVR